MELDLGERREALLPNGFARGHRIPPTSWENGEEAVDEGSTGCSLSLRLEGAR